MYMCVSMCISAIVVIMIKRCLCAYISKSVEDEGLFIAGIHIFFSYFSMKTYAVSTCQGKVLLMSANNIHFFVEKCRYFFCCRKAPYLKHLFLSY